MYILSIHTLVTFTTFIYPMFDYDTYIHIQYLFTLQLPSLLISIQCLSMILIRHIHCQDTYNILFTLYLLSLLRYIPLWGWKWFVYIGGLSSGQI